MGERASQKQNASGLKKITEKWKSYRLLYLFVLRPLNIQKHEIKNSLGRYFSHVTETKYERIKKD